MCSEEAYTMSGSYHNTTTTEGKPHNTIMHSRGPFLTKGLSLDPLASIPPSVMVTAAGEAICARLATIHAFIMSVPA